MKFPGYIVAFFQNSTYLLFRHVVRYMYQLKTYNYTLNIPARSGLLVIANHQSLMDAFLLSASMNWKQFQRFTPYYSLVYSGFIPRHLRWLYGIFGLISHENTDISNYTSLTLLYDILTEKNSVLLFPQGQRNRSDLKNLHAGFVYLWAKTNALLWTIHISNTGDISLFKLLMEPANVDVTLNKPIPYKETPDSYQQTAKKNHGRYLTMNYLFLTRCLVLFLFVFFFWFKIGRSLLNKRAIVLHPQFFFVTAVTIGFILFDIPYLSLSMSAVIFLICLFLKKTHSIIIINASKELLNNALKNVALVFNYSLLNNKNNLYSLQSSDIYLSYFAILGAWRMICYGQGFNTKKGDLFYRGLLKKIQSHKIYQS